MTINKYKDIKNLGQWAIILYLEKNPGSIRRNIARELNVRGERIGYTISILKSKDIIRVEKSNWVGDNKYYLI